MKRKLDLNLWAFVVLLALIYGYHIDKLTDQVEALESERAAPVELSKDLGELPALAVPKTGTVL